MIHANFVNQLLGIHLTGSNQKKWKRYIWLILSLMGLDNALLKPKPDAFEEGSSTTVIAKFENREDKLMEFDDDQMDTFRYHFSSIPYKGSAKVVLDAT